MRGGVVIASGIISALGIKGLTFSSKFTFLLTSDLSVILQEGCRTTTSLKVFHKVFTPFAFALNVHCIFYYLLSFCSVISMIKNEEIALKTQKKMTYKEPCQLR